MKTTWEPVTLNFGFSYGKPQYWAEIGAFGGGEVYTPYATGKVAKEIDERLRDTYGVDAPAAVMDLCVRAEEAAMAAVAKGYDPEDCYVISRTRARIEGEACEPKPLSPSLKKFADEVRRIL